MENRRVCKICGETIIGRSDKIYCSYNCRVYANNVKNRELKEKNSAFKYKVSIDKTLNQLILKNRVISLKIILITSYIFKIFSKFAGYNKHSK